MGVVLGSPLAGGQLAGQEPTASHWSNRRDQFNRSHAMWKWCNDRGWNVRDLAIQFCLALPMKGVVLTGPRNAGELHEVMNSATKTIPPELWDQFEREFGIAPAR